jgi:serine/threonine protein kinase
MGKKTLGAMGEFVDSGDALVGQVVAERYMVLQHLGSGGFGSVYMAKHTKLNNPVAIKVLHPHLIANSEVVQRFEREAEATSRLRHNAITSVHDIGLLPDGRPYMVMEYLSGNSLADIIENEGAMEVERAVPLFIECCEALRYAHRKGLLHRDIKPDNIFITRDLDGIEHAKLLDFGLAKLVFGDDMTKATSLTESGIALGTPWYMSPEQCQAKPLDCRTDIYSLAYSLYEALAGQRPFPGRTHYEAMDAHLHHKVPPLNQPEKEPLVPQALEDAILRSLAKAPNDRFSTADELRDVLVGTISGSVLIRGTPVRAPAQLQRETLSPTPRLKTTLGAKKPAKKDKANTQLLVGAGILVALLCLVVGLGVWYQVSHQKAVVAQTPKPAAVEEPVAAVTTAPVTTVAPAPVVRALAPPVVQQPLYQQAAVQPQQGASSEDLHRAVAEEVAKQRAALIPQVVPQTQTARALQPSAPITMPEPFQYPESNLRNPRPPETESPDSSTSSIPDGYQRGRDGIPAGWTPGQPLPYGTKIPLPPNWKQGDFLPPLPPAPPSGGPPGPPN